MFSMDMDMMSNLLGTYDQADIALVIECQLQEAVFSQIVGFLIMEELMINLNTDMDPDYSKMNINVAARENQEMEE